MKTRNNNLIFVLVIIIVVISGIIVFVFFTGGWWNDDEVIYEGEITRKKIDVEFRDTYYIFELNSTTDVLVNENNYNKFSIGDYIFIFESGKIELGIYCSWCNGTTIIENF